jgi:hypothetical protein
MDLVKAILMETMHSAVQSGLTFLRQYRREDPLELDDDRFLTLHEWFLRELSTIDTLADHLNEPERASYGALCSRCHKRYLAIKEARANVGHRHRQGSFRTDRWQAI